MKYAYALITRFVRIVERRVNENVPVDAVKVNGNGEIRRVPPGCSHTQICP